ILKNCIEHTPDGGVIEVCADETALYSELIIRDNGRGIAKEDLPHVFERFYKGKNSDEKSFGIGLSLAKTIITAQNGTIRAENRREGGAQFTIRFFKGIV
ncbi:MAG: sensor histidine kinase, partial [Clostridia bacterium]|nr:sensor histidine kinase [Clostridia bacterium]